MENEIPIPSKVLIEGVEKIMVSVLKSLKTASRIDNCIFLPILVGKNFAVPWVTQDVWDVPPYDRWENLEVMRRIARETPFVLLHTPYKKFSSILVSTICAWMEFQHLDRVPLNERLVYIPDMQKVQSQRPDLVSCLGIKEELLVPIDLSEDRLAILVLGSPNSGRFYKNPTEGYHCYVPEKIMQIFGNFYKFSNNVGEFNSSSLRNCAKRVLNKLNSNLSTIRECFSILELIAIPSHVVILPQNRRLVFYWYRHLQIIEIVKYSHPSVESDIIGLKVEKGKSKKLINSIRISNWIRSQFVWEYLTKLICSHGESIILTGELCRKVRKFVEDKIFDDSFPPCDYCRNSRNGCKYLIKRVGHNLAQMISSCKYEPK